MRSTAYQNSTLPSELVSTKPTTLLNCFFNYFIPHLSTIPIMLKYLCHIVSGNNAKEFEGVSLRANG